MLRAGVTIGCAAAMVAAAVLAVRLRNTRRTPSPLSGSEPFGERLAVTVSRTGGMLVGAYLGGVLTIGAGARLMMRVLAVTSSDDVQGLQTEADETIGEVSVGGSLFLIVVVGIGAAVVGLALFLLLRRWLPDRSLAAGLVGVAIGSGLLVRPAGLLSSANSDFTLVAPVALAVALCLATFVLFGATFGVLVDRFAPRWPRPGWSPQGVVSVLPFALLLPVTPALRCDGDRRPCWHRRAEAEIPSGAGSPRAVRCRRRRRSTRAHPGHGARRGRGPVDRRRRRTGPRPLNRDQIRAGSRRRATRGSSARSPPAVRPPPPPRHRMEPRGRRRASGRPAVTPSRPSGRPSRRSR